MTFLYMYIKTSDTIITAIFGLQNTLFEMTAEAAAKFFLLKK